MITANFPTVSTLDETLPTPGDPTYQTETLALTLHKVVKNLSDAGFSFAQSVPSDFTSFGNEVAGGLDNYITRYEQLLNTGTSAVAASIPDVLPIIGALLSGGAQPVIAILLQGVLDTILRHRDRRTDHYNGDAPDFTALIAKLEEMKQTFIDDEEAGIADVLGDFSASSTTNATSLIAKLEEMKVLLAEFNELFDKFALIDDTYSRLESFFSNLTINLIKDEEESSFSFTDRVV